jgi:hypothetical protein
MKLILTTAEKQHIENMDSILSPEAKLHIIMIRREVAGLCKLYNTLKHCIGKSDAENMRTLLRGKNLPWDVLLELNIEVDRLIASHQSREAILQYLQISARADLLIERELKAIHDECEQMARETLAERQRRIEIEQENAGLRQLLAQAQNDTTLPSTSVVAQTALHTSASNSAFWQTASTTDNPLRTTSKTSKKRELDATADTQLLGSEAKSLERANKRNITESQQVAATSNDDRQISQPKH